jgi:hypothetical protein
MAKTTFVDCAEFIWNEAENKTQEEIAGIIGWSVDKVHNYNKLNKICDSAWKLITTSFENNIGEVEESFVGEKTTNVGFSEGLLRSILPLTSSQQTELVKDLISGSMV